MRTLLLSLLLISGEVYAAIDAWTQNTPALPKSKSEAIIKAYEENNDTKIDFEDDPSPQKKVLYNENIFMMGATVAYESNSEDIYNNSGSRSESFSSSNIALIIGKDFTLWHEDNTEPTRLYARFAFSNISSDVDYTSFTLGLKENMFYWSIYKNDTFTLYPTFYLEMGSSSLTRNEQDISGFTTLYGLGLTLNQGKNVEYMLNLHTKNIDWEHPIEGVADEMSTYSVTIGINYKLMYGDI